MIRNMDDNVKVREIFEFLNLDEVPDDFRTLVDIFLPNTEKTELPTADFFFDGLSRRARTQSFLMELKSNDCFMLNFRCAFEQYSHLYGNPSPNGTWKYWGIIGRLALKWTFPELRIAVQSRQACLVLA